VKEVCIPGNSSEITGKCHELKVEFLFGTEVENITENSDEIEVHLSKSFRRQIS
jgi:2-polyprenyl-6-methoxyphenol hydroxylase-like FAD-dependent oxidoreductase